MCAHDGRSAHTSSSSPATTTQLPLHRPEEPRPSSIYSTETVLLQARPKHPSPASSYRTMAPESGEPVAPNSASAAAAAPPGASTHSATAPQRRLHAHLSNRSSLASSLAMTQSSFDSTMSAPFAPAGEGEDEADVETDAAGESSLTQMNYSTFAPSGDAESSTAGLHHAETVPPGGRNSKRSTKTKRTKSRRSKRPGVPDVPSVPFPAQTDPSKPLRPKHYRKKRTQHHVTRWFYRSEGYLLVGVAQVFYAAMTFLYESLGTLVGPPALPNTEIILVRMGVAVVFCLLYLFATRDAHPFLAPPQARPILLTCALAGVSGLYALYCSLEYLSGSDVVAIAFLTPLATGFLGAYFLDEPFLGREIFTSATSLCGIVLIARPRTLFGHRHKDTGERQHGPIVQHQNGRPCSDRIRFFHCAFRLPDLNLVLSTVSSAPVRDAAPVQQALATAYVHLLHLCYAIML